MKPAFIYLLLCFGAVVAVLGIAYDEWISAIAGCAACAVALVEQCAMSGD